MFTQSLVDALVAEAGKNGIEPECLLALVEVETRGVTFEQDGRTPQLLYERHKAYQYAGKVSKALLAKFIAAGLALAKWSPKTQYKDQGTSAQRLALIGKARGIDEEVANKSASWGVGQTMGFLAPDLGFASACEMVDHMTGNLAGQIDCMIRELKHARIIDPLNRHEWPTVARLYNGAGYKANNYDAKLADAWKRWTRKLASGPVKHPAADLSQDEIKDVQRKLRRLNYASVGNPDGIAGTKFVGALAQFQKHEGLPVTGEYDAATREAMKDAEPVDQPRERQNTTADNLRAAGSKTIATADRGGVLAYIKGTVGSIFVGGGAAEKLGLLDTAQSGIDKANQAKGIWQSFCDLAKPLFEGPAPIVIGLVLIAAAVGAYFLFEQIKARRVADHNSGAHAGPVKAEE